MIPRCSICDRIPAVAGESNHTGKRRQRDDTLSVELPQ